MALCFIEPKLLPMKVLHCGNGISDLSYFCDLDLNSMTFINELDPYFLEIYWMYKYELPTSMFSKVIVWETDRQADKQTDGRTRQKFYNLYHPVWRVVKNLKQF